MKIIPTSKYGEFRLQEEGQIIAEVTYPNGALGKVTAQMGDSFILIRIKFKILKLLFSQVKEYGITKDDIERGTIETKGRNAIKVIWDPLSPQNINTYTIDVKETGLSSSSHTLYDAKGDPLMIADSNFSLWDLTEEIELQILPSDLLREEVEELAIYFVQSIKWYETESLAD